MPRSGAVPVRRKPAPRSWVPWSRFRGYRRSTWPPSWTALRAVRRCAGNARPSHPCGMLRPGRWGRASCRRSRSGLVVTRRSPARPAPRAAWCLPRKKEPKAERWRGPRPGSPVRDPRVLIGFPRPPRAAPHRAIGAWWLIGRAVAPSARGCAPRQCGQASVGGRHALRPAWRRPSGHRAVRSAEQTPRPPAPSLARSVTGFAASPSDNAALSDAICLGCPRGVADRYQTWLSETAG